MALDEHDFEPQWDALLPHIDTIKIDIAECDEQTLVENVDKYVGSKLNLLLKKLKLCKSLKNVEKWNLIIFRGISSLIQK